MKLTDETMLLVGRTKHGTFWADNPATLDDIKAALAEHGLVAVPKKPTIEMLEELTNGDPEMDSVMKLRYGVMIQITQEDK